MLQQQLQKHGLSMTDPRFYFSHEVGAHHDCNNVQNLGYNELLAGRLLKLDGRFQRYRQMFYKDEVLAHNLSHLE